MIKKEKADLLTKKTSAKKSATHAQYQQQTPMIDSQKLREAMNDQAENIVLSLLGEPKERQGNTLRFGKHKGSLVVTIKGQKQGLWHDFQTGEGGDMLRLFAQQKGLSNAQDYSQLLSEASRYLGVDLSKKRRLFALLRGMSECVTLRALFNMDRNEVHHGEQRFSR
ncbi:MAG: hypothetical protein LRY43_01920, partial [Gammaproteobacteria bacterium]|nr:hypothetical protein [Gammaproteobacteria bacterium]